MILYIIDIICAINLICNLIAIFTGFYVFDKVRYGIHIKKSIKYIFMITLLGAVFIPSRSVLGILFIN